MSGTLEQEVIGPIEQCFEEDMGSKQKIPMPYNSRLDSATVLSGINKSILKSLLETLAKAYKPMSKEQRAITLALQALVDNTKHTTIEEFLQIKVFRS